MDCAEVRKEFSALLDDELAPEQRAAVEAHLARCAECLRDLDQLKRVDAAYRKLTPHKAPDVLEQRVQKALKSNVGQLDNQRLRLRRLWPVLAAAAVFLVVAAAILTIQNKPHRFNVASFSQDAKSAAPKGERKSGEIAGNAGNVKQEATEMNRKLEFQASSAPPAPAPAPPAPAASVAAPPAPTASAPVASAPVASAPVASAAAPSMADSSPAPEPPAEEKAGKDVATGSKTFVEQKTVLTPEPEEFTEAKGTLESADSPATTAGERSLGAGYDALPEKRSPSRPSSIGGSLRLRGRDALANSFEESTDQGMEGGMAGGAETADDEATFRELRQEMAIEREKRETLDKFAAGKPAATPAEPVKPAEAKPEPEPAPAVEDRAEEAASLVAGQTKPAPPAPAGSLAEARVIGDRTFELRDGVWTQKDYKGEAATTLVKDSEPFRTLLDKHTDVSSIIALGDRVIFLQDSVWYKVEPATDKKP